MSQERATDRGTSPWVIVQMPLEAALIAWPPIAAMTSVEPLDFGDGVWWLRLIGAVALAAGTALMWAAQRVLREDLVTDPRPRSGGRLRIGGVYGRLRHPIYAAIIVGGFGWALLWASRVDLALAAVCTAFYVAKSRAEERYLRAAYPGYSTYASKVPGFIPRLEREVEDPTDPQQNA